MRIHRNLVREGRELDGDLLRQRRNVYATSLGLIIYHIAGGRLGTDGEFAALRIHFTRPEWLYVIAIVALVYFLYRYWIVDPGCIARFKEEWMAQTRLTRPYRDASLRIGSTPDAQVEIERRQPAVRAKDWWARLLYVEQAGWQVESLTPVNYQDPCQSGGFALDAATRHRLAQPLGNERSTLAAARRRGFARAILLERTFTDLLAPYGIAGVALIVCAWGAVAPHL